jgi:hypothetical protein
MPTNPLGRARSRDLSYFFFLAPPFFFAAFFLAAFFFAILNHLPVLKSW